MKKPVVNRIYKDLCNAQSSIIRWAWTMSVSDECDLTSSDI